MVRVTDASNVAIAEYEYDGLHRRVLKRVPVQPDASSSSGTSSGSSSGAGDDYETDYYFHNADWQVLETRRSAESSASPETLQPKYQYLWSPRYIVCLRQACRRSAVACRGAETAVA